MSDEAAGGVPAGGAGYGPGNGRAKKLWELAARVEDRGDGGDGPWRPEAEDEAVLREVERGRGGGARARKAEDLLAGGRWPLPWYEGSGASHAAPEKGAPDRARPAGRLSAGRVLRWLSRFAELPEGSCGACGGTGPYDRIWWWASGQGPHRGRNGRRGGARALVCRACSDRIGDWAQAAGLEKTPRNEVNGIGYVGFGSRTGGGARMREMEKQMHRMSRRMLRLERENLRLRRRAETEEARRGGQEPARARATRAAADRIREDEEQMREAAAGRERAGQAAGT